MHLVTLSWVRVSLNRQESLGANEGRFCRNRHLPGLIFWLGQQKTVNTGLVVFSWVGACSPAKMEKLTVIG